MIFAVGEKIKIRRNELNMTLKDLAKKIGVKEATVQRYESGNIKNIKITTIEKIAVALETSPSDLLGWGNPDTFKGNEALKDLYYDLALEAINNEIDIKDIMIAVKFIKMLRSLNVIQ